MKAEEIEAGRLFQAGDQLRIPLWQRHYSWEAGQWRELWDDLTRVRDQALASHFLGSVVLKKMQSSGLPSEATCYWVVDGQQRIATLTLLICAIRDRKAQLEVADADRARVVEELTSQLLKTTNLKEEYQHRLVLQDKDRAVLEPLVAGAPVGDSATLLERGYQYFKGRIANLGNAELDALLALVRTKLSAVWVTLEDGDNAHRVFQTLNAGGKPLRQSDLVRNYFFLLLGEAGDKFYIDSWRHMESDLSETELGQYFVAWAISQGSSGSRASLFSSFHRDLLPHEADVKQVLSYGQDLTQTARLFRWIRQPSDSTFGKTLKQTMEDIKNWSTVPAEGLMLWLLRRQISGQLTEEELRLALEVVLSFMSRRQLGGYEPNLHKSIFVSATHKLASAYQLQGLDTVRYLRYLLSIGSDVRTWPSDQAILDGARAIPIYSGSRAHWAFGVLERINRGLFEIPKHAPGALDRETHSVEHVLPQTLSSEWSTDLAAWGVDDPIGMHRRTIHVLGNLTLTPINRELGNLRFAEKRVKLQDDSLRLNAKIAAASSWTEASINERSLRLAQIACQAYVAPLAGQELEDARLAFGKLDDQEGNSADQDEFDSEEDD